MGDELSGVFILNPTVFPVESSPECIPIVSFDLEKSVPDLESLVLPVKFYIFLQRKINIENRNPKFAACRVLK